MLDKFTITFEIQPHLSVTKRYYIPKMGCWELFRTLLYKLKAGLLWHTNDEKIKTASMSRLFVWHRKVVVFYTPTRAATATGASATSSGSPRSSPDSWTRRRTMPPTARRYPSTDTTATCTCTTSSPPKRCTMRRATNCKAPSTLTRQYGSATTAQACSRHSSPSGRRSTTTQGRAA